jgi:putative oxygen-independent coproporphyrinogen III oxidase
VTAASGIGLYIHWPFCRSKCPYCDFNSYVAGEIDASRWLKAYQRELSHAQAMTAGRPVESLFFGGGTPSLIPPPVVAAIINTVLRLWPVAADVEITLEANPTTAEAERFRAYRAAGVGRLSLGVQALNDRDLRFLGRGHSAAEAREAIALAQRLFPRSSFDLIYARPGQEVTAWAAELDEALALASDHLSLYQLTIEAGTRFACDGIAAADDETAADLYLAMQERLAAAGLPAYEISNHARPGAECRHNLAIWRGGDYIGVGPGAHGRLTTADGETLATRAEAKPERWLAMVEAEASGGVTFVPLTADERREELLILGLRLAEGIDRDRFRVLTRRDVVEVVNADALKDLICAGFLDLDDLTLRATVKGRLCLDAVLARLLASPWRRSTAGEGDLGRADDDGLARRDL